MPALPLQFVLASSIRPGLSRRVKLALSPMNLGILFFIRRWLYSSL